MAVPPGQFREAHVQEAQHRAGGDLRQAEAAADQPAMAAVPRLGQSREGAQPALHRAALARALSALSGFAAAAGPRLASVDVNPLLVLPEGGGCFAADAVVELEGGA